MLSIIPLWLVATKSTQTSQLFPILHIYTPGYVCKPFVRDGLLMGRKLIDVVSSRALCERALFERLRGTSQHFTSIEFTWQEMLESTTRCNKVLIKNLDATVLDHKGHGWMSESLEEKWCNNCRKLTPWSIINEVTSQDNFLVALVQCLQIKAWWSKQSATA